MIRTGELVEGSQLPSERELGHLLGVSRNSVREAVHELELRNLVERHPGRGTVVLQDRGGQMRSLIGEDGDISEIMEFRLAVEPPIAAQAAVRRDSDDLSRLNQILEEMNAEETPRRVAALDVAFHNAVAAATHNSLLVKLQEVSAGWLRASRRDALQTASRRAESLAGHRRIADAIAGGDQEAAWSAVADHIGNVKEIVLSASSTEEVQREGGGASRG